MKTNKQSGFASLVLLLIVLAITLVIAGLAVPALQAVMQAKNESVAASAVHALTGAEQKYFAANSKFASLETLNSSISNGYAQYNYEINTRHLVSLRLRNAYSTTE